MITAAFVRMWGELVGAVSWDVATSMAWFEYDPSFARHGWDIAPLTMPIRSPERVYGFPELRARRDSAWDTFRGLPGLLADALPDRFGTEIIQAWLAGSGRSLSDVNPVELLCFLGSRAMGALEFEPALLPADSRTRAVEIDQLVELAQEVLRRRSSLRTSFGGDDGAALRDIIRIGTSAGGARAKAVIAWNPRTGEVRSGQGNVPQGFEHWLIKLDGVRDAALRSSKGYGRVEMAYHRMALACGIEMMPCRLLEEGGRAHFMARRFDRAGGAQRHHVLTWCGMQHLDYNDVHSHSYEMLFQTLRTLGLDYRAAEQQFRRMVFNIFARNCDDHSKNTAFLLRKDAGWELAPAYDLCHAWRPDSPWVSRHALSANGKREHHTRSDLLEVARLAGVKHATAIVDEVRDVLSQWKQYADDVGVPARLRNSIEASFLKI